MDEAVRVPRKYPLLPVDSEIGWMPYLWTLYLLELPFFAYFHRASALEWAVTLLAMVAGAALYFYSLWVRGLRSILIVCIFCVLGTAFSTTNNGSVVFFIFGAAIAPQIGSARAGVIGVGSVLAVVGLGALALPVPTPTWLCAMIFSAFTGAVCIHGAQRRRMHRQLKMAQAEVERLAKMAERERIARDLHDVLGHTLSLIVLKSELASKLSEAHPERAAQEIRDVERISREALSEVRAAVRGYRSAGLAAEMEHTRAVLADAGIQFTAQMEPVSLAVEEESVIVLAMREAVTNIVRHSEARNCRIELSDTPAGRELKIRDDGCGGTIVEGCGLQGMRERVESLHGTLTCSGADGMTVSILIPRSARQRGVA